MTLGGQPEDLLDLATQPAASEQQAQNQQQHRKRQRRGGPPPQVEGACIVDLAIQSSCELQGSPAAAFGGSKDLSAVDGRTGGGAAAAWAAAPAAAAGHHHNKKRLWGELAASDNDVVLVESSSTRHHPRARRTRYPSPADAAAAAAAMGPTVVEILDDEPPNAATLMKQQLHLQGHRHRSAAAINPAINPPMRPVSIAANPSIPGMMASPTAAAAAAGGRRRAPPRAAVAGAARPAARAAPGQRRTSTSSSSSTELVDVDADAALARKLAQEEKDRVLAQRLMQEEEQRAQVSAARLSAAQRYQAEMQAAAAAAAAGAGSMRAGRPVFRAPPASFFPPYGYDPADTAGFQTPRRTPAAPAAAAAGRTAPAGMQAPRPAQQQRQHARFDVSQAIAQVLLSMPMPRWSGRGGQAAGPGAAAGGGGGGARRGLPSSLVQMRDAVLGMQRAGLPPHLLFSDRDFTADDYELLCRLDETVENRKGASTGTIEALPTQTVPSGGLPGAAAGERLSCAVCLEEFVEGSELRCLPCLHKFHKGCIDTWLRQKAACPVCNRDCS